MATSRPAPPETDRPDGRAADALRPLSFTTGFLRNAYSSVLVEQGGTRVLCTASVDARVPGWLEGRGLGWVTAEYDMLPASTGARRRRDARAGKVDGRTVEISRLVGRSLRAVIDRAALGERLVTIDCDVIDADGGTRCAAIAGGWVALALAVERLRIDELLAPEAEVLVDDLQAVSVGIVGGEHRLDLEYVEDSVADVDMNLVATGGGRLVEVQAAAEGATFDRADLDALIDLALAGCATVRAAQLDAVAGAPGRSR